MKWNEYSKGVFFKKVTFWYFTFWKYVSKSFFLYRYFYQFHIYYETIKHVLFLWLFLHRTYNEFFSCISHELSISDRWIVVKMTIYFSCWIINHSLDLICLLRGGPSKYLKTDTNHLLNRNQLQLLFFSSFHPSCSSTDIDISKSC